MNTVSLPDAADLAVTTAEDLAAGRFSQVVGRFNTTMREGLSEEALAAACHGLAFR